MKKDMVVTNLRMPRSDYLQVKLMAGELGMSVNEYVSSVLKTTTRKRMMKPDLTKSIIKEREALYKTLVNISKVPGKPMGWSEEDETIYSI